MVVIHDLGVLLDRGFLEEELRDLDSRARTGWRLGDEAFVSRLEGLAGQVLRPRGVGRKARLPRLPQC